MKLICQTCHVEVTNQVVELDDLALLIENDGEDYIPEGFFVIEHGEEEISLKNTIIINRNDLINSNLHQNKSRLNGCCGYDGLDGINRVCINNHEIGTEKSDCWMPHFIALHPDLVKMVY